MNSRRLATHIAFLALVVGGGLLIGATNTPDGWYASLAKPQFNPPNWIFGPVWTILYVAIALSGVATLAGPFLAHAPALHGVLAALGCRALA